MTKSEVTQLLNKYGLRPEKRFGQNFLTDGNVLANIIKCAQIEPADHIIEVGPGLGVLTKQLAAHAKSVVSVEIDKKLISVLERELAGFHNVRIISGDVMKTDIKRMIEEERTGENTGDVKVVANLPYSITTPFICNCLESEAGINLMVVMVQKEAAERFLAAPATKAYGAATLVANCYANVKLIATVAPSCFYPAPDVTSAIVLFNVLKQPRITAPHRAFVFELIRAAFSTRRKTLVNCLSAHMPFTKPKITAALESLNINPNIRGEALTLAQFEALALRLKD